MNEKEMIEEMAKTMCARCLMRTEEKSCIYRECFNERLHEAEEICNLGYRKLPKDAVVLTKEELNDLEYKAYSRGVCFVCKKVDEQKEQARKETAKEISKALLDCIYYEPFIHDYELDKVEEKIKEIAKQYGVEIKE